MQIKYSPDYLNFQGFEQDNLLFPGWKNLIYFTHGPEPELTGWNNFVKSNFEQEVQVQADCTNIRLYATIITKYIYMYLIHDEVLK